jgi:hypothetical protein
MQDERPNQAEDQLQLAIHDVGRICDGVRARALVLYKNIQSQVKQKSKRNYGYTMDLLKYNIFGGIA